MAAEMRIFARTFKEHERGRVPDFGDCDWSGDCDDGYDDRLRHEG